MNDEPKMMPDQAPYSPEERARLDGLLAGALDAEEQFSEDELERYAARRARQLAAKAK